MALVKKEQAVTSHMTEMLDCLMSASTISVGIAHMVHPAGIKILIYYISVCLIAI